MCNFQPGEVLAFGPVAEMQERIERWAIPGEIRPVALLGSNVEAIGDATPYDGMGFLHATDVPEGLELLTVSKLSAALSDLIYDHRAVVEPNYILPFAGPAVGGPAAYSAAMQTAIKEVNAQIPAPADPYRIAVMDSGVSAAVLTASPPLRCFDYMGATPSEVPHQAIVDQQHHGDLVCRIVADVMDGKAELMVGRVAIGRADVTVLSLSLAHAHMVATTRPDVINLSVAPKKDVTVCPHCKKVFALDGLHSMILPRVFQLAGNLTWTVMAAGNTGKQSTGQHHLAASDQLVLASAYGTDKVRAPYSGYANQKLVAELPAFGGDDPNTAGGQGVLNSGKHIYGTSFAAPLVSCALAGASNANRHLIGTPNNAFEVAVLNDAMQTLAQSIAAI